MTLQEEIIELYEKMVLTVSGHQTISIIGATSLILCNIAEKQDNPEKCMDMIIGGLKYAMNKEVFSEVKDP